MFGPRLPPRKDFPVEMIFVKIDWRTRTPASQFLATEVQYLRVHPVVEYQDAPICFDGKATVKNICKSHFFTIVYRNNARFIPSLTE